MSEQSTESLWLPHPGPYLARVVNNLDPELQGALEVVLYEGVTPDSEESGFTCTVKYLPSFWGTTSSKFEGNNSASFNDVQKSYGMWFVPPDIDTVVLCMFIGGNRNAGYWLGVVPDRFQNHMIPGIAASRFTAMTPEQKRKYGTEYLPVAEFSIKNRKITGKYEVNEFNKPVHPFADRLLQQGLLLDDIRGVTSSSARREHPSGVFGISTPGPVDSSVNAPTASVVYNKKTTRIFHSRLGGHQLVMDDGDKNGLNELFRIRTRTGHQILLHNSSDLIYIANAAGSAWIELTGQGKIDIFAQDSVSIHTEGDFNLRADRDFNIEAVRDVNIKSGGNMKSEANGLFTISGDRDAQLSFDGAFNLKSGAAAIGIDDSFNLKIGGGAGITTENFSLKGASLSVEGTSLKVKSAGDAHLYAKDIRLTAEGVHLNGSTTVRLTSPSLNLNGARAATASSSISADGSVITPTEPEALPKYSLPNRLSNPNNYNNQGWADGKFFKAEDLISIMKRVPTHEPWDQHENINPTQFTFDNTDLENDNRGRGLPGKYPSVTYNRAPAIGTPPTPSGDVEEDNIAAFLWMIRVCEGTSGPNGYRTQYTGRLFESFADHPRQAITAPINGRPVTSTAAGAYQFLSKTWDECKKVLQLPDFSPQSQDKAAIYLVNQRRALDDVRAGRFTEAVKKTKTIWASLPGSPYDQNPKNFQTALGYYKQGGGTFVA